MVLMPRPYKEDKEIEQELKEEIRLILKRPCTFDPQRGYKEAKPLRGKKSFAFLNIDHHLEKRKQARGSMQQ